MIVTMNLLNGSPVPKRGDLLHTNIGDRRERTWLILHVRFFNSRVSRCRVWAERWWQIEPELRMQLFRSAERNGGQHLIAYTRPKAKKCKSFEEYMQRQ
ncbi:MAG TPA: hypothetical protein VE866_00510 [Candidatus Binatia bacterium]|nr:hypothetical protein [Candidatus Binatia bacterium]